nr:MAG TPA: hypothetical protein [Caudoviricetes sp.]
MRCIFMFLFVPFLGEKWIYYITNIRKLKNPLIWDK